MKTRNWNDNLKIKQTTAVEHHSSRDKTYIIGIVVKLYAKYLVCVLPTLSFLYTHAHTHTVYFLNSKPHIFIIYKSLSRWLWLVVNLSCWKKNLVWSNKAALLTNENKWWQPIALASKELRLLLQVLLIHREPKQTHPPIRKQYFLRRRREWRNTESAGFLEWRWWRFHSCSTAAHVHNLPANLKNETLRRNPEHPRVPRKGNHRRPHLPSRKAKEAGPKSIHPPSHETPPNWRKTNRTNLIKSFPGEKRASFFVR